MKVMSREWLSYKPLHESEVVIQRLTIQLLTKKIKLYAKRNF